MLTKKRSNSVLALLLTVLMTLSVFSVLGASTVGAADTETSHTLYLKPNANWIKSDARFAMYVTGNSGSVWVSMTDAEDGCYQADVPDGDYTTVVFARMNPNTTENTIANRWNYSKEMTIPTDDTNCFTVDAGQWSSATGEWSIYIPKSSLKKLYLKPNSNWIKSDARFAMYVTGESGSEWISMDDAGDGYYTAYVPTGDYTTVAFARMNGSSTENTLANRWNYSSEMTIPTDETNCFTIDAGQWNNPSGKWSTFTPTVYEIDTLYLKPNKNWAASSARFAMYLYGGESTAVWISMTSLGDGTYKAEIPNGDYKNVMFARMNPATTENVWANAWNQSDEFEIPTNGTNRFVVGSDQWSSATGTWDSITELDTLYLKPNKNWLSSNARFAMYLYGGESSSTWVSMTNLGNGTYKADIPEGHYTKVIFVRMKGSTTENVWGNLLNESEAQRIPNKKTDMFTINSNQWASATGVWETYTAETSTESSTAATINVSTGDVVNYWVEISIPRDGLDVAGWTIDMYYDSKMFNINRNFADGYGFASGDSAVEYALGLSDKEAEFPGGSLTQGSINNDGRASFTDVNPNGLKFKGKTTKVICIQLVAIASGKTTLSYQMRDLVDTELQNSYVDKENNYQPAGGAVYSLKYNIDKGETPTEAPTEVPTGVSTEVPTEAPTEVPTEAPTEVPTEAPTEVPTEAPTEAKNVVYFVPSTNWTKDGARFAVYMFGGNSTAQWISMTETSDGYYMAEIPEGYTSIIFVRMNGSTTENSWSNKWNQTADITLPNNGSNLFTLSSSGWEGISGTWSKK